MTMMTTKMTTGMTRAVVILVTPFRGGDQDQTTASDHTGDHTRTKPERLGFPHPDNAHTPEGARRLKAKIEAYWQERGAQPRVDLVRVDFHEAVRMHRFDLRSDMLNGLPTPKRRDLIDAAIASRTADRLARAAGRGP